jgi:CHAD domain-containing protein
MINGESRAEDHAYGRTTVPVRGNVTRLAVTSLARPDDGRRVKHAFAVYSCSMTTSMRETERKYEAPAGSGVPSLAGLPGVTAEAGPEEFELEAVYYDTEDLRLARGHVTLRRRTGGEDEGWHLKLPVAEDTREEVRAPLDRGSEHPPAELTDLARAHLRGAAPAPVAHLLTTRRRWQLVDGRGELLAEVVEDVVTGQTTGEGATVEAWREIEVELGSAGDHRLLDAVEERLADAGIVRSSSASKLSRLLAGRLGPADPAPRITRRSSAGDVVLAYLREQVTALKRHDPGVRRDEHDAVHQMRVATRRLRSALQAYGKVVDRERTRALTDELKWLAGVLGGARDLEVMRDRFTRAVDGLDPELLPGPVAARLTRHFAPQEAAAREEVLAALDGQRHVALLDALDALLADPPLTGLAAERATVVLPRLVRRAHRRLAARADEAVGAEPGPVRDTALHESRKAAKRVRYSLEVAVPVLGKRAKRFRKRVKGLQTLLGEHQDSVVARPVLLEIAAQAHADGENAFAFGLLHGRESACAARVEERFTRSWREVRAAEV